jgi:hypothetical protein
VKIYYYLGWLGVLAVPIAPATFFGWRVYTEILTLTQHAALSTSVGLVSGISLEIVGIMAGHMLVLAWASGERQRAFVVGAILLAYVGIGVYELAGTIGATMFVIAPLVYFLVGMETVSREQVRRRAVVGRDELNYQRQTAERQAEREHEARLRQLELQTQAKIEGTKARVATKLAGFSQNSQNDSRKKPAEPAKIYECACGRVFEGSRSYNGHRKHCKIESAKVYENGHAAK